MNAQSMELPSIATTSESGGKSAPAPEQHTVRPERVMVCINRDAFEPGLMTEAACIAARLRTRWYAVYVAQPAAPSSRRWRAKPRRADALQQNLRLAAGLGATIVRVKADRPRDGLLAFARQEGITHLMCSERVASRWSVLWRTSTIDWMLSGTTGTAVLVVPVHARQADHSQHPTFEVEHGHLDNDHHAPAVRAKLGQNILDSPDGIR